MKNLNMSWRFALLAFGFCGSVLMGETHTAQAQGQGKYPAEASKRLVRLIDQANKDGYSLPEGLLSIGGGWIKQGFHWTPLYTIHLTAGTKYRFLVEGDYDAKDCDLEIQDAAGKTVARDTTTSADCIVDYTPKETGKYLVRVRLYASRNNVPCVVLAIALVKK